MEEYEMNGLVPMIIGVMISSLIGSLLLNTLNNMYSIFNSIQKDLGKLTNKTRYILRFSGFVLMILITVFLNVVLDISSLESGLVLGFLLSLKDICFKSNVVENI